jgi:hypothetical protein
LTFALAHAKADALLPQIHELALLITSDQVVVWHSHSAPLSTVLWLFERRDAFRCYNTLFL